MRLEAAVNRADRDPGTTFVVTQIEVVSVGDPHVGGYKVIHHPHRVGHRYGRHARASRTRGALSQPALRAALYARFAAW